MAYQALYRKFRPSDFDEVKGQDHIVTTLKNQIKNDRIGHAYIFTGTRGTGKTTAAKIFAKAINCENPVDGSPCGQCAMCQAISAGTSMNVIEMDAASNNKVDDIRSLIEQVAYPPTEGRYKVYIMDEVHMLTPGAFNALLKTLEEPPSYVVFVMATTEIHKLPITILSRCQRYDFHRISLDTIAARLADLCQREGVDVEEKAIRYIARVADGSMRDGLSVLDQCIAFYIGQTLTYDNVLSVLGAVDTSVFSRLLRAVLSSDVAGAISIVDEIIIQGRELMQFVIDFTWYLRNLMLMQSSAAMEDMLDVSTDNLALIREEAGMVDPQVLMRYIHVFSELANEIKYSSQKRVLLEIGIIKLCKPQMEDNYDAIVNRINQLEEMLASGAFVAAASSEGATVASSAGISAGAPLPTRKKLPDAVPEDIVEVVQKWRDIKGGIGGMAKGFLLSEDPALFVDGDTLQLIIEADKATMLESYKELIPDIEKAIEDFTSKHVKCDIIVNTSSSPAGSLYEDPIKKFANTVLGGEIEVEDKPGGFE